MKSIRRVTDKLILLLVSAFCIVTTSLYVAEGNSSINDEEGWRTALRGKEVEIRTCDERFYPRALCERLARDFTAASKVSSVAPEFTATTVTDPRLKAEIISCTGDDLGGLLLVELAQQGLGRAQGPFAVYRVPVSADGDEHEQLLLQVRGYAAEVETAKPGDMYGWSHYVLVEPKNCRNRPALGFYHGYTDTTKVTNYWDGVVQIDGMVVLYSVEENPSIQEEFRVDIVDIAAYRFGEKRHPIIVSFIAR